MIRMMALVATAVLFASPAAALYAQSQETGEESETAITGCLNPADMEGYFVIEDETTNEKTTVTGLPSLARHSNNHKVTVTGAMTKEQGKDVMKVTKVQMLAVCN